MLCHRQAYPPPSSCVVYSSCVNRCRPRDTFLYAPRSRVVEVAAHDHGGPSRLGRACQPNDWPQILVLTTGFPISILSSVAVCGRISKDVRESFLRDSESYVLGISKHAHRSLHIRTCPVPGRLTFVALRQVQPTIGHKLVDAAKRYFARPQTCPRDRGGLRLPSLPY